MTLQAEPQFIQLTAKGLFTMPNSLSEVPKGSLLKAENIVIDYNGLISGRRGIKQHGTSLAALTGIADTNVFQEFFYKGVELIWYGDPTAGRFGANKHFFGYDTGAGVWATTTHPFPAPAYALTDTYRSVQSNNNFYLTSVNGLLKTDNPATPLYSAGGLPGLDGSAALVDAAGFMDTNTEVAYRMTWTYTDANKNAVEGTPSTRLVIANASGGSRNVNLTYTIPKGATTKFQWKIYRTIMSATSSTDPGDEEQLALQGFPDSTDITNGYFTVKDTVPQSQLQAALYTNALQQGIAQANTIPPVANDVCFFFGYVIYGSCTTQQKFLLSLLSAEPPLGVQVGDTITFNNGATTVVYTGAVAENIATNEFQVFTGGDPASDILNTKISLIHVINRSAQTLIYAFDASDTNTGLPGDMYFQEQGIGGGPFGVASSRSTCWSPALTTSVADNQSLAGGGSGSGFCSKFQEPEAVPLANTINVGNPNFEWLRCLPLRNSVIVLKADGLFQLTGTTFPFTVTTLDTGTILTAPETAAILNNQVFAYTNQGVVAIAETGPGIISRPIENILQQISSNLYPNFPAVSFGSAYETDRKYLLSTISSTDNYTRATVQYVYDTITETWSTYVYPVPVWDILESPTEHRLYVASASSAYPYVFQERKTFTRTDFADIEIPVTITGYDNSNPNQFIVDLSDTSLVQVGWSLVQLVPVAGLPAAQVSNIAVITGILSGTQITVNQAVVWDLSMTPLTALEQPIPIDIIYCPIVGTSATAAGNGNPGIIKFFKEIELMFQNISFDSIAVQISSDFIPGVAPINLSATSPGAGWGEFGWGTVPWGGNPSFNMQAIRTYIPLAARRAHWLNLELSLNQAMVGFTYGGCVIQYQDVTTRFK